MANTRKATGVKAKAATEPKATDVDALLARTPEQQPVTLTWRGEQWTFDPLENAPLSLLLDDSEDAARQTRTFLNRMLAGDRVLPDDTTMKEAMALLNVYTETATGGVLDTGN